MKRPEGERYSFSYGPHVVAAHSRRTAQEAAYFLLPQLEPGMRLLDFGCGPGTITVGLAGAVHPGEVVGIDLSDEVLGHAGAAVAAAGLDNVVLERASAYEVPAEEASFDVAYAHQVLQHLADPVAALEEVRRVLRPGGLVAVRDADYGTMTHHPNDPRLDRWLDIYHGVARANGGEPDAGRRLPAWLLAAGFELDAVTSSTWTYADANGRRHWADLWTARVGESQYLTRAVELGLTTVEEVDGIAAAWQEWAARPDGFYSFIHGEALARKPG